MGDDNSQLWPELPARKRFPVVVRIPPGGLGPREAPLGMTAAWTADGRTRGR
jgi:hypothetical protein